MRGVSVGGCESVEGVRVWEGVSVEGVSVEGVGGCGEGCLYNTECL